MARQPKNPTIQELLATAGTQLKLSATRPNLHAYRPHPKQEKFHASPARHKLYIGGNRSGKTVGGVVEDLKWCSKQHEYRILPEGPIRGRVIGVDFENGIKKIILPIFGQWTPPSMLINGSWEDSYSKGDRVLTFANESFIEFMSYDQDLDKFAGTSRHFVHFDEEPPKEVFTENGARLVDTRGNWWMTMTPVEGMTWVYDDIYLKGKNDPEADILVIEVEMAENPYLPQMEVQAFLATLDADERLARGKGKFVQIGGLVYKKFDTAVHVIDPIIPPKTWAWYASLDHGYNNPTAWLWHAVSPDGDVITFGEHYEDHQTVDYHSKIVHARNANYGRDPDYYVGDPAIVQHNGVTATSIQTEYAMQNIGLMLGDNSVLMGINRINQYLEIRSNGTPTWHITRNCINLIREIQRLRFRTFASKKVSADRNKQDLIHKKDDHACDSARYFFSMLPDLRPQEASNPSVPPSIFPDASVGIDAFIPHLIKIEEQKIQTEWQTKDIDEYMGSDW